MKKLIFSIFAVCTLLLASCSKDKTELLATVPSDTAAIVYVDIKHFADKLSKEDIEQLENALPSNIEDGVEELFEKDGPVDLEAGFVCFEYENNYLGTVRLKDGGKFRKYIKEEFSGVFNEKNGVWVNDDENIFVVGNQAWFSSMNGVSTPVIKKFAELKPEDSAAESEVVNEWLEKGKADVKILIDIKKAMAYEATGREAMVGFNMLFDDPKYIAYELNFDKGKCSGTVEVLNDKAKIAPFALKLATIDVNALRSFKGKGDIFFALGLNPETTSSILSNLTGLGLPMDMQDLLKQFDGNIVVSTDLNSMMAMNGGYGDGAFDALFTMTGAEAATQLVETLKEFNEGAVNLHSDVEGNTAYVSINSPEGGSIAPLAGEFKDAVVGLVYVPTQSLIKNKLRQVSVMLKEKDGGLVFDMNFLLKEGENSLVTIVQLFGSLAM